MYFLCRQNSTDYNSYCYEDISHSTINSKQIAEFPAVVKISSMHLINKIKIEMQFYVS